MRSLLHISDIHFGPGHQPDRAAAVIALAEERNPDFLVVSGDLTLRAKPHQFKAARQFVDRIEAPVLAVPGNHDVPLYRVWSRVASPYWAYRKHFHWDLEPRLMDDEVSLIGLNTAHGLTFTGGRLRRSQLRRAAKLFSDGAEGAFRVAVLHHHMVPPPGGEAPAALRGSARALYELSSAGVDLVLSGHVHRSFLAQAAAIPEREAPLLILHCGTTTSHRGRAEEKGRNTCNWIEVESDSFSVASLLWSPESQHFEEQRRDKFPRPTASLERLSARPGPEGVIDG